MRSAWQVNHTIGDSLLSAVALFGQLQTRKLTSNVNQNVIFSSISATRATRSSSQTVFRVAHSPCGTRCDGGLLFHAALQHRPASGSVCLAKQLDLRAEFVSPKSSWSTAVISKHFSNRKVRKSALIIPTIWCTAQLSISVWCW